MKRILIIGLSCLLVLSGCGWFQTKEEKSAEELAGDGMDYFDREAYRQAIDAFEKIKDWYPFSKYAILAELKIADAHYALGDYEEAVFAYENFENLHPRNESIPYVIFQIGKCYFDRIDTVDRDQVAAQKATESFDRLIKQYPQDDYARKAADLRQICLKSLAGHEFEVGLYYYRTGHYKAALHRFKAVVANYPDVGVHGEALRYITLCEKSLAGQEARAEGN
jgi:outer membrane protein assembly factor BamD